MKYPKKKILVSLRFSAKLVSESYQDESHTIGLLSIETDKNKNVQRNKWSLNLILLPFISVKNFLDQSKPSMVNTC